MSDGHNKLFMTMDNIEEALGTLGAVTATVVNGKIDATREHGVFIPWVEHHMGIRGKTAGNGPISYGVTNLSAAELAEALVADPQSTQDEEPLERARRGFIKILGTFGAPVTDPTEDLPPKITKIGWTVPEGGLFRTFFFNHNDTALTTGSLVGGFVRTAQRWIRD